MLVVHLVYKLQCEVAGTVQVAGTVRVAVEGSGCGYQCIYHRWRWLPGGGGQQSLLQPSARIANGFDQECMRVLVVGC